MIITIMIIMIIIMRNYYYLTIVSNFDNIEH